ncbi:MAG: RNA-binding ATPase activator esf2 [Lichina confinis]|nr:MAG: RNA-binding ATPase activator esf2 [Lichina confinis]
MRPDPSAWFGAADATDDDDDDQDAGYDSEAGQKRKGGGRLRGPGARPSKMRRLADGVRDGEETDDDDDDDDDDSGQDGRELDGDRPLNDGEADNVAMDAEQEPDLGLRRPAESSTARERRDKQGGKKRTVQPLTAKDAEAAREKSRRSGVIYISRIPPFMKPAKVRSLLLPYGPINRIFLTPEDTSARTSRVKGGGNRKRLFIDGWVEFESKRDAKLVAESLNTQIIGGKKGNYYHDDVWNIKYLRGFKWHHLTDQIANENAERAARLRTEISKARKQDREFVRNVEIAKRIEGIQKKRALKKRRDGDEAGHDEAPASAPTQHRASPTDTRGEAREMDPHSRPRYSIAQREVVPKQKQLPRRRHDPQSLSQPPDVLERVLGKIF